MRSRSDLYRRIIALFFLAAFVSAIGKNISCDIWSLPLFAHHDDLDDHGHNHGDIHHHHAHKHTAGSEARSSHDHEHDQDHEKKDDKCCKKLAKALSSGLSKPADPKYKLSPDLAPAACMHVLSPVNNFLRLKATEYYSWKAPPPKVPDIRIYIRSFTI